MAKSYTCWQTESLDSGGRSRAHQRWSCVCVGGFSHFSSAIHHYNWHPPLQALGKENYLKSLTRFSSSNGGAASNDSCLTSFSWRLLTTFRLKTDAMGKQDGTRQSLFCWPVLIPLFNHPSWKRHALNRQAGTVMFMACRWRRTYICLDSAFHSENCITLYSLWACQVLLYHTERKALPF